MAYNNTTNQSGTLMRDKRAKTQPAAERQPKDNILTLLAARRYTYHHSNDETQRSIEEDEIAFARGLSKNTSMDSGLGSKMSSTLSIDNMNPTDLSCTPQQVTNDASMDTNCNNASDIAQLQGVSSASDTEETFQVSSDSSKDEKDNAFPTEQNLKEVVSSHASDSNDDADKDFTGKHLTTIHELAAESNENVETKSNYVVVQKTRRRSVDKSPTQESTSRLYDVWMDLFGRCLRIRRPASDTEEVVEPQTDLGRSDPQDLRGISKLRGTATRPDSGYDTLKELEYQQRTKRTNNTSGVIASQVNTLTDNHDKIAIHELVQALQHFQSGQRMSDDVLAGKSVQIDNFAAAFLTNTGGRICLPFRNVNLYVPPGAIPSGMQPQLVYIYVLTPVSGQCLEECDETWLTPSVHCGPSGLKFNKDVFLTMPHCAVDIQQWEFTMHQVKQTDGGVWRKLDDTDDKLMVVKQREKVTMLMNHFCGQKGSGKCASRSANQQTTAVKKMTVTVSSKDSLADGDKISMNISITNKVETSLESALRQNLPNSYLNPGTGSLRYMSEDRFRDLCLSLDFLESSSRGWTEVAGKLGDVSPEFVHTAKRQLQRSPSAILLDSYFQTRTKSDEDGVVETLSFLSNVCEEIDSYDPKRIVDEEITERYNKSSQCHMVHFRADESLRATRPGYQKELIFASKELLVQSSGKNLVVQVDGIRAGWTIDTARQIIDFDDVWSRCNQSETNTVTIDAVADKECIEGATNRDPFACAIHVYQDMSASGAVTFDIGRAEVKTPSDVEDSVKIHAAPDKQPIQASFYDFQDGRLRQSLTSVESKKAWSDLMSSTGVFDHKELVEILSKQDGRTTCPAALALDLFYALHDNNTQALQALKQHESQSSENAPCVNGTAVSARRSEHDQVLPTPSLTDVKRCMVASIANKWKSMVQRYAPTKHNTPPHQPGGKTTQQQLDCGNAVNVVIVENRKSEVDKSGFQDGGIDNPAFHCTDEMGSLDSSTSRPTDVVRCEETSLSLEDIQKPSGNPDGKLSMEDRPRFASTTSNGSISSHICIDINETNKTLERDGYSSQHKRTPSTKSTISNDSGYAGTIERDVLHKMVSITEDDTQMPIGES